MASATSAATTVTMSAPESVTADFVGAPVTVSPTSLGFGNVQLGVHAKKTVTVENHTANTVQIGPITLSVTTGNPSQFSLGHVRQAKLRGGQSCTIAVLFTPSAIATDAATLNIVTSAPGSPIQIPITQRESRRSDGEWLGRFALVAVRSKMFRPRTRAARFRRGSGRVRVGDWETVQRHSLRARKNRQSSDPSRHNANLFKLDRKTFYANGEY